MTYRKGKDLALLATGLIFMFFSNGRWSFPLAAWLYPFFILQVSRRPGARYLYLWLPILTGICAQLSFWKFTYDSPDHFIFYLPFILGVVIGLLFYADRLLYTRNAGLGVTLYFPLLYTSFEFIDSLVNPFGTTGALGYTQLPFLSFCQLASITGIWGLTFMITWFGSVATWYLDHLGRHAHIRPDRLRRSITIYAAVLIAILSYGGIRLALPLPKGAVSIAGLHTHDKDVQGALMWKYLRDKDSTGFRKTSDADLARLVSATIKEAAAGVKIVIWSEVSPKILRSAEDSVRAVCGQLSARLNIYLLTTPFSVSPDGAKSENKILLFGPDGKILLTHYKFGGNFLEGTVEGDKQLKAIPTPYGRLSAIICWDADFPSVDRQIGRLRADILLNPASDWKEIAPLHSYVAVFRGIENGCSVVREDRNGLSLITDPRGRTLAQVDHFTTDSWITVAQVPIRGVWTLYPIIGDIFGWLCLIGLLFGYWIRRSANRR